MHIDIFKDDAFSMGQMIGAIEKTPFVPHLLGTMNLFTPNPVRTEFVAIEAKDNALRIIQTTERGSPLVQNRRNRRNLRRFDTVRIAKSDTIRATEIAGVRAFGSETELMQAQEMVAGKQIELRRDMELTFEKHRLGAVQGIVLDADGQVINNWFTEWGISAPAVIEFKMATTSTEIELICRDVQRKMMRAAQGLWLPGTYIACLCGDKFFDMLTTHKTVKETYLNQAQAASLRQSFGVAAENMTDGAFATFNYGGILFINYRGADNATDADIADGDGVESIGIASTDARFFPVGAPGVFQVALSPAESFDYVNTPGLEMYSMIIPDDKRNQFVDVEVYSYPLFMCTRPEMLMRGVANTAAQPGG